MSRTPPQPPAGLSPLIAKALERRRPLMERLQAPPADGEARRAAFRVFSGPAEGADGVFVDVYGPGATLVTYEGQAPTWIGPPGSAAAAVLDALRPIGVRAVYHKPFARDRSRLGGELPPAVLDPSPAAGEPLPPEVLIDEHDWTLEIQLFGGLSTGLFLDQRENRAFVRRWAQSRAKPAPPSVLNTFAYTCAFSVAAAIGGAATTSVDVSPKYLDWGRRNFAHSGLDPAMHRFARMDTFEFFRYATRKSLRYDLIILDPPSFATGSKKKGIRPFSSVDDYPRLVREAAALLHPRGTILASTNTRELCAPHRLEREVTGALDREPRWIRLPAPPEDFSAERQRFAAVAFTP